MMHAQSPTTGSADDRTSRYWKGDGTGNDFIILLDLSAEMTLKPHQIAAWCNRKSGIGADGLLRVIRCDAATEVDARVGESSATFFMDYRNADGSVAETCGNGLRVFTRFLQEQGLIAPGRHTIATRAGDVAVVIDDADDITVDMGPASPVPGLTQVTSDGRTFTDVSAILMPNPHAVVFFEADPGDLGSSPTHQPVDVLPHGANYEFVQVIDPSHVRMRVYERGVGETLSCGSGACAVAYATAARHGLAVPWQVSVDVPGGALSVRADIHGHLHLSGPAHIRSVGTLPHISDSESA